jgi:hypothetical protein
MGNSVPLVSPDAEEWKDFGIDIAYFIPAVGDCAARYEGTDSVVGRRTHKLAVDLPLGDRMTYSIGASGYLLVKVERATPVQEVADQLRLAGVTGSPPSSPGRAPPLEPTGAWPHLEGWRGTTDREVPA